MSDIALTVNNLGKRYRIGDKEQAPTSLREGLISIAASPFRYLQQMMRPMTDDETLWALRNVSFDIKRGEVVGFVGRNGAGKSTLLKILSRITEPTEGRVVLNGRVGSLLEVGTGFHPELTGRENIFLNGSILGMKRVEIERKFDEIVAFSEIEKFLDTPVKRYSSGMAVRLAFAVAAHLEPEIMVIDEVLAVGDLAFQKKCLGKMEDVAQQGRTILFVSHNMQAVRNLCTRCILLDKGRMIFDGTTAETASLYFQRMRELKVDAAADIHNPLNRRGSGAARFTNVSVKSGNAEETFNFTVGETVRFEISYEVFRDIPELFVAVAVRSGVTNEIVTSVRHLVTASPLAVGAKGTVIVEFPDVMLKPGIYPLYFWLGNSNAQPYDVADDLIAPLDIGAEISPDDPNFVPQRQDGYFSIPSQLTQVKLDQD